MKYDLDISIDEKLRRLSEGTLDLILAEEAYRNFGEDGFQPVHVADYEHWKMTNKRSKR